MGKAVLPAGWSNVKLHEIADIVRGVSYDKEVVRDKPSLNFVPLLRATNIHNDELLLDNELVYVPPDYVGNEQLLKKWDVVVCMSSGSRHLVGKTGQLTSDWHGTFGTFCAVIRFSSAVHSRFAGYFFQSQEYRQFISQQAKGVNINNLRAKDLTELNFPLPPLPEQHAIVTAIETQFTRLDAAVAALKRVRANLRRYRASVLKAACEGRLVPTEAELAQAEGRTYEPASALLQRILLERRARWQADHPGKKYKEPVGPDTSALPELPEGWCWARVKQVGEVQLGRQRAPQHHNGPYMRPYLRVANVYEDRIDTSDVLEMNFTPAEFETFKLQHGDILLNEGQSPEFLGRPAMYRGEVPGACFQNTLIRFQAHPGVLPEYALSVFRHYMHSGRFQKLGQITTNIAHLSAGRFAEVEFPLPPLAEQERIVNELDSRLSEGNQAAAMVAQNAQRAARLRQSILQRAFRGELTRQLTG